jgi:hypothetical protein
MINFLIGMEMKFIKNINKYKMGNYPLIDNIKTFIKLNNGIQYYYGDKYWYKNGIRHRNNDKPAIEHSDGRKEWWINNKFIRSNLTN